MSNDLIRYDLLVQEALCGVVKKVLGDVARHGLPGDHHFYITFRTHAPGVRLSSRMRELYPEEMTIILQHQFENLKVTDFALEVGLSFKGIPEMLLIPFDSLTGFFDPSVQFSAKFEPHQEGEGEETDDDAPPPIAGPLAGPGAVNKNVPAPHVAPILTAVPPAGGSDSSGGKRSSDDQDKAPDEERPKVVSIDSFRKKT